VDVEISHYKEQEANIRKNKVGWNGVDPSVRRVDGGGIDQPEGMKL